MSGLLDPQMGWLLGVVVSLIVGAVFAFWKSAELGLGVAVVVSLLFPDWLEYEFLGMPFSIRTTVAAISIITYAVRYPWRIKSPLIPLDFAVAALVIVHTASDYYHGLGELSALRAYGEWALPYVCGRYALRRNEYPVILGWFVCGAIILMSAAVIVEMSASLIVELPTPINVWDLIFGRPIQTIPRGVKRFGLVRAFGNSIHPIFFAMQLIVLLPWPIYLWRTVSSTPQKVVLCGTILIAFLGCIATVSRSPVLAFLAMPVVALAFSFTWARIVTVAGIAVLAFFVMQNPVDFAKETAIAAGDVVNEIEIDGQMVPISSGMSRIWLYRVYWPSLRNGGMLGHGSYATRKFPLEVPRMPRDPRTLDAFKWVDNAYLLIGLRFGWLGITALLVFLMTTVWTGLSLRTDRYWSVMAITSTSMFLITSFFLLTVWLSNDFGFEMIWMAGVLAGIRTEQT